VAHETDSLIRKLESVGRLTGEQRAAIEALPVQVISLRKGQDAVIEGETVTRCLLLLDGFMHRYKALEDGRRQIFAFHTPGDIPDLHSLNISHIDHSIAATGDCHVGYVSHAALREAFASAAGLVDVFWRMTLIEGAIFRNWMLSMGRRDAVAQMAHLFCELFARLKAVGLAEGNAFHVPLIQEELADAMGISTVHANRVLQQLRRRGLVTFDTKLVQIPDWAALRTFAGFDPSYLHLRAPEQA
jgi:CRP-like cAMP-binding protein